MLDSLGGKLPTKELRCFCEIRVAEIHMVEGAGLPALADAESETGIRNDAAAKWISCIESNGRARAASERGVDRR